MTTCEFYKKEYETKLTNRIYTQPYYSELLEVSNFLPDDTHHIERIYCLLNNIKERAKCEHCGKDVKFPHHFRKIERHYRRFCSTKCSNNNENVQKEKSKTCMINYGVDNPSKSVEVHRRKVDTVMQNYGGFLFASPEITKRILKTNLEKYGDEYPSRTKMIQSKCAQTIYNNFGKLGLKHPSITKKRSKTKLDRYGLEFTPMANAQYSKIATKYIENYIKTNEINKKLCKYGESEMYIRYGKTIVYYDLVVFKSKEGFDKNDISDISLILEYDGKFWHPNINQSITYRDKLMKFGNITFREKYLKDLKKVKFARDLMIKSGGKFVIYKENQTVRILP